MSQINNLKYYNKVTCALKWARKLPRKTETYESAKCVPCNTRKCTHNGFVSDILKWALKCKFYATGPWSQVSWFDGEVCCKSVIWVKVSKNIGVLRVLTQLQRFRLSWGISFLFPLSLFCCSLFSFNCSLWDTVPVFLFQFQMGFSLLLR